MGAVNLLEAARRTPSVRSVIIVTSDKCYENKEWLWGYRESDPMGGHDPYSSSKGCAELVTAAYMRSFFPFEGYGAKHNAAVASVRAGNVIGGGDWAADRLIPDCVRFWRRNEEIAIRNPLATRPWQHVLEPLGGYLLLAERLWTDGPQFGGPWNFGPSDDDVWPVEDVVREMIRCLGAGAYRVVPGDHKHEARMLKLDCSKARCLLGWRPRLSLAEALRWTAEWYKFFYSNASTAILREFTEHQISGFMNRSESQNKQPNRQFDLMA
jgi:CDP-glucose 4,6-dehydratase